MNRREGGEEGDRDGQRGEFRLGDRGKSFILESTGVNVYSWPPTRDPAIFVRRGGLESPQEDRASGRREEPETGEAADLDIPHKRVLCQTFGKR